MTDQCGICVHKGDYKACIDAPCSRHENWINKAHVQRIAELEAALLDHLRFGGDAMEKIEAVLLANKESQN